MKRIPMRPSHRTPTARAKPSRTGAISCKVYLQRTGLKEEPPPRTRTCTRGARRRATCPATAPLPYEQPAPRPTGANGLMRGPRLSPPERLHVHPTPDVRVPSLGTSGRQTENTSVSSGKVSFSHSRNSRSDSHKPAGLLRSSCGPGDRKAGAA